MELIRRMQIIRRSKIPFLWVGYGKKQVLTPEEIRTETLATITSNITDVKVVIVHDGHCYGDLIFGVRLLLRAKKHVILSGDDIDLKGNPTLVTNLVAIAQKVDKYVSICVKCLNDASFIHTDKNNKYINLCFDCFEQVS